MSFRVPVRVPVEIRASQRWFRLAWAISEGGVQLAQAVPDEVEGVFALAFHLPGDPQPIRCRARAEEVVVGEGEAERAERRDIVFLDLDEGGRARIDAYVQERLGLYA